MSRRQRTAKGLGTRHDLNYFKSWSAFRRWRFALALGLPLAAALWLGAEALRGNELIYISGPMSSAHAVFGQQCSTCHAAVSDGVRSVGFFKAATDGACLSCHEAPAHAANQTFTPTCGSCHMEHQGAIHLARTSDNNCVACHGDLQTTEGAPGFANSIFSFNTTHPEFAAVRPGSVDPGAIAFPHASHLRPGLLGPSGPVRLDCGDCHRTAAESGSQWAYAAPGVVPAAAVAARSGGRRPWPERAHMEPITYEKNCAACHLLRFDARIPETAPHDQPEAVAAFVHEKLRAYLAANPGAWRQPSPLPRIPGRIPSPPPRDPAEWLEVSTADSTQLLWRQSCNNCHTMEGDGAALPRIMAANLPVRWMPHSSFSHEPHKALSCLSCHQQAAESKRSSDVLLPRIASCQSCHSGAPVRAGVAENGCFLCHDYHQWDQRKRFEGTYTIPQLIGREGLPPPDAGNHD